MNQWIWVFIGGGLGSVARLMTTQLLPPQYDLPIGTLAGNAIACAILGYIIGYNNQTPISQWGLWLIATGFCGGYSTFSTFSLELWQLLRTDNYVSFFLYLLGSVIIGIFFVILGYRISLL